MCIRCACHDVPDLFILCRILSKDITESLCGRRLDIIQSSLDIVHQAHERHRKIVDAWSERLALRFELVKGLLRRKDTGLALLPGLQLDDT